MQVRRYEKGEERTLRQLFFQSIRNVCIRDYTSEHIEAWAAENFDLDSWRRRIEEINPFVAVVDGMIVGYADVQTDGYIDHFYTHFEWQGKGVGTALMRTIVECAESHAVARLYSDVSVTARPFFEARGFHVLKEQFVSIAGQSLKNYRMERSLERI